MILASGGRTDDWYLQRIIEFRTLRPLVYAATGYEITIDQMNDIPEAWMDAILAYEIDLKEKIAMVEKTRKGATWQM